MGVISVRGGGTDIAYHLMHKHLRIYLVLIRLQFSDAQLAQRCFFVKYALQQMLKEIFLQFVTIAVLSITNHACPKII